MSQLTTPIDPGMASREATGLMRAGVYRGKGQVVVESVPIPEIGEGEVLFRVAACGICGTDIKKIKQGFVNPPRILGHELAGTVVKTGRGVTKFKAGDRVVSFHHIPCGDCFYCEKKLFSQCAGYKKTGLTAGFDASGGGFAEFVRAMPWIVERGMLLVPDDVTFEEATFVEPLNTCLKAVRKARVAPGETVVVIGQGPIGMPLAMLAKLEGATVYTSDPMAVRREASVRFGARESFDPMKRERGRRNSRANQRPRRGCSSTGGAECIAGSRSSGDDAAGRAHPAFRAQRSGLAAHLSGGGRGNRRKGNSGKLQRVGG